MAVISLSGLVVAKSIRVAGDELDEAIISHIKKTYNLMIGERTAEMIKIGIGSAKKIGEEQGIDIKGRDLINGLPKTVKITSDEIRECLQEPICAVVDVVKTALEETPPELSADIMERGIMLAGGGSMLRGLDSLLADETGLPVHVADDPLTCVVMGTGKALDEMDRLKAVIQTTENI